MVSKSKLIVALLLALFYACNGQSKKMCSIHEAIKIINLLPEVQRQSKYVDSISHKQKHLSFLTDTLVMEHKPYYRIKTGYNGRFHWEKYTIFYVDAYNCTRIMVDEVVSGEIMTLEKWRLVNIKETKMNKEIVDQKQAITFSDLFNEGSNIYFTPYDLSKNDNEIQLFKSKLLQFESISHNENEFKIDDLQLLINNETFSNNERFIHGSWFEYFINKYIPKQNIIDKLMNIALEQEDFSAVKVLTKFYIFSKRQIDQAIEKKNYKDALKGKLDIEEYYDPRYSKIDEILPFIKNLYIKNHVIDPDGYTNLRKEKSSSSEILQKIKSGEHIEVLDNTGDWYFIKTKEGRQGYVHRSRVKAN